MGNFSNPFFQQPSRGQYASIVTSVVAPTSRGNVTLGSGDVKDLPIINPNWLDTESDQKLAIAAYRRIREVFQTPAVKAILTGPEYFPGSQYQTDAEILNIIKNTMMTIYHASCTCKMGTRVDSMAVVDHRARVFGVEGLRVVDASAFPILPPGHPQSVVCEFSPSELIILVHHLISELARYACRENCRGHYCIALRLEAMVAVPKPLGHGQEGGGRVTLDEALDPQSRSSAFNELWDVCWVYRQVCFDFYSLVREMDSFF